MNDAPPYMIGPKDVTKAMLLFNVAPSYDHLTKLIKDGIAIEIHNPDWFDQDQVVKSQELNTQALLQLGKLSAPELIYNVDVIAIFDRLWKNACVKSWEEFKDAILKDQPEFDLTDKAKFALAARTITSASLLINSAAKLHTFSSHFMKLRMKHGVDLGLHSAVTAIPDIRPDDNVGVMSLVSMHGIESPAGDERLYIDLYRPAPNE